MEKEEAEVEEDKGWNKEEVWKLVAEEKKTRGGGKCQMVDLRHSMSGDRLQKDGRQEERNITTRSNKMRGEE